MSYSALAAIFIDTILTFKGVRVFFFLIKADKLQKCSHSLVKIVSPFSSVLHAPLLLSDSRLHLFIQSDLGITKMEKCAVGKTRYTVAEAIQRSGSICIDGLEDKASCESDCERYLTEENGLYRRHFSCYKTLFFLPAATVLHQAWD